MSKKSNKKTIKLVLNITSIVLALFVVVSFFCMPVFTKTVTVELLGSKTTSTTQVTCLDLTSVGFRADEDVSKDISQAILDGKDVLAKNLAYQIRENEDSSFAFGLTLIVSYVALLFAVLTLIFSILSMFTKTGNFPLIFAIGLAASLIVVFIGGLLMAGGMGKDLLATYSVGFGAIITMIVGLCTVATTFYANKK